MYRDAILGNYKEHAELVALSDTNPGRLALAQQKAKAAGGDPKTYPASDFDRMLAESKPDAVIVTTVDCFHHEYIIKTLDAGLQAITEKPMTNTAERCQAVLDAVKRNDRHVRVTFNYRYSPPRTQVKDILKGGFAELDNAHQSHDAVLAKAHDLLLAPSVDRAQLEALRAEQIRACDAASKRMLTAFEDAAEVLSPEQRAALAAEVRKHHGS
jgi:ABC-type molybdate transport system ATPase subunit